MVQVWFSMILEVKEPSYNFFATRSKRIYISNAYYIRNYQSEEGFVQINDTLRRGDIIGARGYPTRSKVTWKIGSKNNI